MDQQNKAYLYALLTVILWSTVASAFKISLRHLTFAELLLYASYASLAVLSLILVPGGRLMQLRQWPRRDFLRSAFLGLLNPALYYLLLFKAYELLPAQEAQPLNFTWPLVLVLFSAFMLGQRLHPARLSAMLVSFAGVIVISTRGDVLGWHVTDPLGVSLALASTLVWALYWTLGVKDTRDPAMRLCLNFLFGAGWATAYALIATDWRVPSLTGLIGATYVGLFEMGITFLLWLQALRLSKTTAQVGSLIYLAPFLSLIVIHFVVGEPIFPSTVLGLTLIVLGIIMQGWLARRQRWRGSRPTRA